MTIRALLLAVAVLLAGTIALSTPKNVILMIGDGMGPDTIYAAGAYKYGKDYHAFGGKKRLMLETLSHHLYMTTASGDGKGYDFTWAGGNREYVKRDATDSAAAATAMATGVKTYDAAIGVDLHQQPQPNIIEVAKKRGLKTGIVTTVPISHATPAGFAVHNENRNNYAVMAHEMLFTAQLDVVMGAGHPEGTAAGKEYEYISQEDWKQITDDETPYYLVQDRAQFQRLTTHPRCGKVLGIFRNHSSLKYCMADRKAADPNLPTLAEMTLGALETLNNENGFFLMVEGGAIDWCNHANDLNGSIGETLAFDDAVAETLKWIARNGGWRDNVLIITADHDTGYLNNVHPTGKGKLPTVKWGTGDKPWTSHTNRLVDVYYQGDTANLLSAFSKSAADFERGNIKYIDNTHIFKAVKATLELLPIRPPVEDCVVNWDAI